MMISVIVIRPVLNSAVYSEEERGKSKQGEYCPVYSKSKAVLCVYLSDMLPLWHKSLVLVSCHYAWHYWIVSSSWTGLHTDSSQTRRHRRPHIPFKIERCAKIWNFICYFLLGILSNTNYIIQFLTTTFVSLSSFLKSP